MAFHGFYLTLYKTFLLQRKRFYYLVKIQFLGYRLHGWQRQPGLKTIEGLIKKTLKFVLGETRFKILGASRTDAMVSAEETAFELFIEEEQLSDLSAFLTLFNKNLPPDIRSESIREVHKEFNIIQHPKKKKYVYLFAFGAKNHPFCAPLLATFVEPLNLEPMKTAATIFEGTHYFHNYCTKPTAHTVLEREILSCKIVENEHIKANFFPEKSYALEVEGTGFLRNQMRLMMGSLVLVGRGELSLDDIKKSLEQDFNFPMTFIAPGSGLMLRGITFEDQVLPRLK